LVAEGLLNLEQGYREGELPAGTVDAWVDQDIARWAEVLGALTAGGWLDRHIASAGRALLTVVSYASEPTLEYRRGPIIMDDTRVVLSPFALARRDTQRLVLESALTAFRISFHDPALVCLLGALAAPKTLADVKEAATQALSSDEVAATVRALAVAGMVATDDRGDEERVPWSFADSFFHARSRLGRHHGGYGGTYPLRDVIDPLPALKPVTGATVRLPAADADTLGESDPPLGIVAERRTSIRVYDDASPITVGQLSELLYRAQRIRSVHAVPNHGEVASRPYPSGGALYELEIYPVVHLCHGLPSGLYRYDGAGQQLEVVRASGAATEQLVELAQLTAGVSSPPQVLLVITARFRRVMWKYESMAYAAILKNVGVLIQTLYLHATALGLAPCALGGGDSTLFSAVTGIPYESEGAVGEFVVGSKPAVAAD
jgi:SagB-type dehydrogenase family enzyme